MVVEWLQKPLNFGDAVTAPLNIVDLWGYQRNIDRFALEPEWLYRLRVHYALINAVDAGTRAGMQRIFARLQMPELPMDERVVGYDWDMVRLTPRLWDYINYQTVLHIVLQAYRRTCRRWLIEVQAPALLSTDHHTSAVFTVFELDGTGKMAKHTSCHTNVAFTILEMP